VESPIPEQALTLSALCHHRWIIPTLAAMYAERGATRFVVLHNRLGASRDSLRTAITVSMDLGLIERNPGHGHPLRPEYLLTGPGQAVGAACAAYATVVATLRAEHIGFRKWTAQLLHSLHTGHHRYSVIQTDLCEITPRALSNSLRSMSEAGLVERGVEEAYPPRSVYRLSRTGLLAANAVALIVDQIRGLH
jgi:DNA-binding HxlR family transcriptional regulator